MFGKNRSHLHCNEKLENISLTRTSSLALMSHLICVVTKEVTTMNNITHNKYHNQHTTSNMLPNKTDGETLYKFLIYIKFKLE